MIIEANTKPLWCPNCNAKDKRIAELEKAIEILQSKGKVIAEGTAHFKNYNYEAHIGDKELVDISENLGEQLEEFSGKPVRLILQELQIDK